MKRYKVIAKSAPISTGLVELTGDQARSRMHNLKARGGGVYEVLKPIEFKRGEEFGHDGDPGKGKAVYVEVEGKAEAKPEPKPESKPKKK